MPASRLVVPLSLLILAAACDRGSVREVPAPPQPAPVAEAALAPAAAKAPLEHEVLLTAGASEEQELPLLVAVHGLGGRPERFRRLFEDLAVPARVVLPRAPTPTASGGGSWFEYQPNDPDRELFGQRVHAASVGVVDLLVWAEDHYPTTGEPVVTGFSQGGMVSFAVAAGWPEEVGAVVPVGGDLALSLVPPASSEPASRPSVYAFHGEDDQVVPIGPVSQAIEALRAAGYDATLRRYSGAAHGFDDTMRADYHRLLEASLGSPVHPAVACFPREGQPLTEPVEERVPMGDRAFVALSCPRDDGSTVVRAWLEGGDWTWESSNVYEEPDFENEILYHRFEHVGALSSGEHVLAHFHHDCELENCDRTDILFISPDGTVAVIVAETQAGRVSISPSGDLEYQEKTAYSAGYHVASAEFTYRWDGSAFERQPDPVLRAEYDTWPCPDSEVVPVDRSNGEPAGEPIPVQRGGTIEVLDADSGHPGELFEYRVGEQRFWAKGWMQTCAG